MKKRILLIISLMMLCQINVNFCYSLDNNQEFPPQTLSHNQLSLIFNCNFQRKEWKPGGSSFMTPLLFSEMAEKIIYEGLHFSHKLNKDGADKVRLFLSDNSQAIAKLTEDSFFSPNGGSLGPSYSTQIATYALYTSENSEDIFRKFTLSISKKLKEENCYETEVEKSILPKPTVLVEKRTAPPRPPRSIKK